MKILQMLDVPWDSGLTHYALALAQGLKRKGHHVMISTIPGQKPWQKAQRLGLRTVPLAELKGLKALRGFIIDHHFDVINAHTGSTHSLAVAATVGHRISIVRTRSDARRVRQRIGSNLLFKRTQRVIAAANYIRDEYLRELKLPDEKVVTIYQGVDLDAFTPAALPKSPVLGIVARLDPVKGHRYLLEALTILKPMYPQLRVKVIGQEENVKTRELRVMAERLRVDSMVEFCGYSNDIPKMMSHCSLGLIASTGSEAVSRAALEWMAAGRAVIATDVGCLPEIVRDRATGFLIPPKNAPAIARALASLLHEPTRLQTMGAAARERAEDEFSLKQFVGNTEDVYQQALELARATPA